MPAPAAVLAALLVSGAAAPGPDAPAPDSPAGHAAEVAPRPARLGERSWFAIPVVFWLPETRLGFGVANGLHFHVHGAKRASSVFLVGTYTVEKQGSADVAADLSLPGGSVLASRVRLVHFPQWFYGIGPDAPTSARESFTRRFVEGAFTAEYAFLGGRLRGGPRVDLRTEEMTDLVPGGALASGAVPGTHGFSALGMGGSVTWDTRDTALFTRRGSFAQAWMLHYPGDLGRDHATFTRGGIEGRLFLPLGAGRVLGTAAFFEQASGATPFTLLPRIGSSRFLRGYRDGRYRDLIAWAAQAELRVPLAGRLHGTAFGSFGDVGPDLGALRAESLKVAGGVGLRFRLTNEGATLRLDGALSGAGPEAYLTVLEAF